MVELQTAGRPPYWLRLIFADGRTIEVPPAERRDLLICLEELRKQLEAEGLLICCQGARASVVSPGLIRQFSGGRNAVQIYSDRNSSQDDEVDIFAPADCDDVVSLAEQYDDAAGDTDDGGLGLESSSEPSC